MRLSLLTGGAIFPLIDDDRMLTVFITCNSYDINTYVS